MGQALYRKYRSRSLDEIVGQEHITRSLEKAIEQDRISHAYLLTGPRGVGKTSIARILAHEINGLPYEDDSQHIDIIEIDAASNRRIDEIRDLREKVNIAPASAKYKVYIIDEVHMLTKEAFNALLKTLEEPPAHVVFVLATTDAHKLPDTIVSRTQRYSFRPVGKDMVVEHLKDIAQKEKIAISSDALALLADHGDGSFRDSISLLDQASNQSGRVELHDLQYLLGLPASESIADLIDLIAKSSTPNSLMQTLQQLYDQGFQAAAIANQLSKELRKQLYDVPGLLDQDKALDLMSNLLGVSSARSPERYLEIVLLKSLAPTEKAHKEETVANTSVPEELNIKPAVKQTRALGPFNDSVWPDVLMELKKKHNTLYGVIRMAQPKFNEDSLQLAFAFPFHQKRGSEPNNQEKLTTIIYDLTGKKIQISCVLDSKASPTAIQRAAGTKVADKSLDTISNIFGKAELLES